MVMMDIGVCVLYEWFNLPVPYGYGIIRYDRKYKYTFSSSQNNTVKKVDPNQFYSKMFKYKAGITITALFDGHGHVALTQ